MYDPLEGLKLIFLLGGVVIKIRKSNAYNTNTNTIQTPLVD